MRRRCGYLPHVKREGASYFVTFRLADYLPQEVLLKFERESAERLRTWHQAEQQGWATPDSEEHISRDFRRKVERYLDQGSGACHLRRPEVAELVVGSLLHFEGQRYLLGDWVVMPNHVHAVGRVGTELAVGWPFAVAGGPRRKVPHQCAICG